MKKVRPTQVLVTLEVPGVDDGGEVLLLRAPEACDVPADGRPVRVKLFEFETETEIQRVLMAETVAEVVITGKQRNAAGYPLLAGPVDLPPDPPAAKKRYVIVRARSRRDG